MYIVHASTIFYWDDNDPAFKTNFEEIVSFEGKTMCTPLYRKRVTKGHNSYKNGGIKISWGYDV